MFLTRCLVATLLLIAFGLAQQPRPSIIFLVSDEQGWRYVGAHRNKDAETPMLDRLASEGFEVTRSWVVPVCAPTRAGLMTGRH